MTLQTHIGFNAASAVPGDKASLNPCVYTVGNPLAEGDVAVASFVWQGGEEHLAKNSGAGKPLGFVERVLVYPNYDVYSPASMIVPNGQALTVARKGDFYAQSTTASEPGDKVFAVSADGTLKTAAIGANVSGAVETDFTVTRGGEAGATITISNWS